MRNLSHALELLRIEGGQEADECCRQHSSVVEAGRITSPHAYAVWRKPYCPPMDTMAAFYLDQGTCCAGACHREELRAAFYEARLENIPGPLHVVIAQVIEQIPKDGASESQITNLASDALDIGGVQSEGSTSHIPKSVLQNWTREGFFTRWRTTAFCKRPDAICGRFPFPPCAATCWTCKKRPDTSPAARSRSMSLKSDIAVIRQEIQAGKYQSEADVRIGAVMRVLAASGWDHIRYGHCDTRIPP